MTSIFAYISFFVATAAQLYFISKGEPFMSTITAIGFWALAVVFYKMKDIDKFKVDLANKEIDIEDTPDEPKK